MAYRSTLPVLGGLLLASCATSAPPSHDLARAALVSANGLPTGSAVISERGDVVTLTVQASGLTIGLHGTHLHSIGKCDAPAFASAGGHLNPAMHQHGTHNPAGSHLGDLPNLDIAKDGAGAATTTLPGTWQTLATQIFDADGTAIVIHAAPDDYQSDPSGNSGARIACGVFAPM